MWMEVCSVLVIFYKYEKCPKSVTVRTITQFERFTVRGFLADTYATYIGTEYKQQYRAVAQIIASLSFFP